MPTVKILSPITKLVLLTGLFLVLSISPAWAACGANEIATGLGCIPTDPTGLVNKILEIAIGVSSGIALLLLISGALKVLTSSGDPKAVMEGKDTITSAIAGLLLILLSVAILNIIGINILGIPIWKKTP